jgi:hypothetical protein
MAQSPQTALRTGMALPAITQSTTAVSTTLSDSTIFAQEVHSFRVPCSADIFSVSVNLPKMNCTREQQKCVDAALRPGVSVLVNAPAGSGKGVTLAAMVASKTGDLVGHLSLAATGNAAMNAPCGWLNGVSIPATTVHQKLTRAARNGIWSFIKKRRWAEFSISIDEFVMLPAEAWAELHAVVQEHLPSGKTFKVAYYLTGDVYQIGSIGRGMLEGTLFWQWFRRERALPNKSIQLFRLTNLLRFAPDDTFYRGLYFELYRVDPCAVRLAHLLQTRVLRPPAPSNDCRWLTQTNEARHRYNSRWFYAYVSMCRTVLQLRELEFSDLAEALATGGMTSIPPMPHVCTFVTPSGTPIAGGQLATGMEMVNDRTVLEGDKYIVTKGERFVLKSFGGTTFSDPKRKRGDVAMGKQFVADKHSWVRAVSTKHPRRGEHLFEAPYFKDAAQPCGWGCTISPGAAQGDTIKGALVVDVGSCKTFGELVTLCTRGSLSHHFYVLPFQHSHLFTLIGRQMNKYSQKFNRLTHE